MPSQSELTDTEVLNPLPPVISNNLRVRLEAERVSLSHLILHKNNHFHEHAPSILPVIQPDPCFPHEIAWYPRTLHFAVGDNVIVRKLKVCNASARSLYIQCGQFSNVEGRLGASWYCLRRNRFLLAPGIVADIYVKASPREHSPIPSAHITLQLASAHMRDTIISFYQVPIFVKFLKYIPPCADEDA